MEASSFIRAGLYKSPLRVVAGVLLRSREVQVEQVRTQALVIQELRRGNAELRRGLAERERALQESRREVLQLRSENRQWREQPLELPCDLPLPQHGFGARMMAVCVNLAQAIGLRSSVRCLRIVLDWLGMVARLPDWTTVRTWLMRCGVAAIEEPVEVAEDWVWMADHSNQIGPEKVLVVLGVRASKWPSPGVALTHADMRVLAVEPGVSWKREDMSRVYATLAARIGAPQALVVDGAVELREGAEVLRRGGTDLEVDSERIGRCVVIRAQRPCALEDDGKAIEARTHAGGRQRQIVVGARDGDPAAGKRAITAAGGHVGGVASRVGAQAGIGLGGNA